MKHRANPFLLIWTALHEPRIITLIMLGGYAIFAALGTYQILTPAPGSGDALDAVTRWVVAVSFTLGGVIGVAATPRGIWQAERAAIVFLCNGFLMHLWWTFIDPRPGVDWAQSAYLAFCMLMGIKRYVSIRWARLDPTRH